ncbi:hypothetical protein EWM64_g6402 [Hericium alpestre]|uniref:Uncharacterized protein n=1 Tax=Hericium alpestre TaxID=135208 RepID=A0A4Y9ZS50_9AGAM|nr:hypothetical protein EWM64_g6402 [Hericium alpestre]
MYAYFYHGSDRPREDDDGLIPYQNTSQSARAKFTTDLPFTPVYVQKNLAGVPDPATTYNERVKKKQLHLGNPAALSRIKKQHDAKRAEKQELKAKKRLGVMNRKEAAEKGLWKLKKEETKYDLFVPLHHMWLGYMSELLGLSACPAFGAANASAMPSSAGMHTKLVKADFHGSIMTVRRSKNSALVGLSGIVIHETENAFRVVTQKNKMKCMRH